MDYRMQPRSDFSEREEAYMTERQAQIIFQKNNPAIAVTRCPNGRAPVRALLDTYARAAVNLYGVISIAELSETFNNQNAEQTNPEGIFTLLLPLVLKKKWYCFYKGYIVHYWAMDDFDYAESWLREQGDKPRFVPARDEFLKFENQYYESETQASNWERLHKFVTGEFSDNPQRYRFMSELKEISEFHTGIQEVSKLLAKFGLVFSGEKQAQKFFSLLMDAKNNTRMWSNKGYSPNELLNIMENRCPPNAAREIKVQKRMTVGPNDLCPCGSGKKYKKCCRLVDEAKTAQLTPSECRLFYETWYGLMGFINEKRRIINATIKPEYPNKVSDEQVYKVRQNLWEHPTLIDDYLAAIKLPAEKIALLESWRDHYKKDMFFVVRYTPEYAVVIGSNEQKEDTLYGVKGISRSLSDALQRALPTQIEAVLLPYKDRIIYDGFLGTMPINFGEGAQVAFNEMYEKALVHGITTNWE